MARIEHHTPELSCLVLSRPEAVELINLLVAQLGDVPPSHGCSGACPTVRVQDGEQAPSRLSFLVEPDKHFTADTIKEGFLRAMRERGKVR